MHCWGKLKSLRARSVDEVNSYRICGNESQPELQIVEKLASPLAGKDEKGTEEPYRLVHCKERFPVNSLFVSNSLSSF